MYDVIIIGAGPAGMAAAVYAGNNKLKTLVLAKAVAQNPAMEILGLLTFSKLKSEFEAEIKNNKEFIECYQGEEVGALEKNVVSFSLETKSGKIFYAKTIIIATGEDSQASEGNSQFDLLTNKDGAGKIKVNNITQTNIVGIFAAGGVTSGSISNVFLSAGEGAKAALSALRFLREK